MAKNEWLSTGSNWKDAGISALSGFGNALEKPGKYYIQANWRGNGIANTGLGYLKNPNYRDYFSAGQALASLSNLGKNKQEEVQQINKSTLTPILGRLSKLGGNLGNWSSTILGRLNRNAYGDRGNFDITGFEDLV